MDRGRAGIPTIQKSINPTIQFCLERRGGDENLFKRGDAIAGAVEGDHAEGSHSLIDGELAHFAGTGAGDDEFADLVADGHDFDYGQATGIAGIFAAVTAMSTKELNSSKH